jgi:hypothetical protein
MTIRDIGRDATARRWPSSCRGVLEIRGDATGLIDEPLVLRARGGVAVRWRARLLDDDGRSWRAQAERAEDLAGAWAPAKAGGSPVAALASLRPVRIDVRAETAEGPAAARTLERRLVADGVKVRRWRAPAPAATLFLPAGPARGVVVLDADAVLAGALLASRGVVALAVGADARSAALELLVDVPAAAGQTPWVVEQAVVPPGVPAVEPGDPAAWDALLARAGARPRAVR